jgi:hypothetical protein
MPEPMPPEAEAQLPLPEYIDDLGQLHPYWSSVYEPVEGGGFRQCREMREMLAETEAAYQAEMERLNRQHEVLTRRLQKRVAEDAIQAGLRGVGGVKKHMDRAVTALLMQELKLVFTEDADGEISVTAETPYGPANVSAAVATWAASAEAQAYLDRSPSRVDAGEIECALKRFFER